MGDKAPTGPPPPDYGAAGENKEDRAAPGGDLGGNKGWNSGSNSGGNWNSGGNCGSGGGGNQGGNWGSGNQGGGWNNGNQGGGWNNGNQGGGWNNNNQGGGWNNGNQGGGWNNGNSGGGWNNGNQGGGWNTGNQGGGWDSSNNWSMCSEDPIGEDDIDPDWTDTRPQQFEPDPSEPDYRADVWEYIHYAASRVSHPYYPGEMSKRIAQGNLNARGTTTQWTPMHVAADFGEPEGIRLLIQARADIDPRDVLGQTPLSLSCCLNSSTEIPRQLLDAGASIDAVDRYSWTPLFWAAYHGFYDVAQYLVSRGANKYYRDKRGNRPIDHPRVASNNQMRSLLS